MTFYPSFLSLILELTKITNVYGEGQGIVSQMLKEEKDKSNPAVQRVKLIMSFGLLTVHVLSRWSIFGADIPPEFQKTESFEEPSSFYSLIMKQFVMSADHIVILILLVTLMIKFIIFESSDFTYEKLEMNAMENSIKTPTPSTQTCESVRPKIERQRSVSSCSFSFDRNETELVDSCRSLETCLQIYRSESGSSHLTDKEIMLLVDTKHIPSYNLEKALNNLERGVAIRRKILEKSVGASKLDNLPYKNYDYSCVLGSCCENVLGYVPIPLGEFFTIK